jgi:hypothetical protein
LAAAEASFHSPVDPIRSIIKELVDNPRPDAISSDFIPTLYGLDNDHPPPLLEGGESVTSHESRVDAVPTPADDPSDVMWTKVNTRSRINWQLSSGPLKLHLREKTTAALARQGQRRYQVRFTSPVPDAYEWGVPLDTLIQFTVNQRHNLKGNKTEPQFVILGRAIYDPCVFGILWRLISCQAEYFPPVITNRPGTQPTRSLHMFLHGYQGVDHATENKVYGSFYSVPHGWGGPSIYRSWAMAWAASADFKILAYQNLPGSSLNAFTMATRCRFSSFR